MTLSCFLTKHCEIDWCVVYSMVRHRRNYLAESELMLQKALDIAMAAEMAVLDWQQIHTHTHTHTHTNEESDINVVRHTKQCQCCGKRGHVTSVCCLQQSLCYKCGKRGHLQVVCKSSTKLTAVSDTAVKQVIPNVDSTPLTS